LAKQNYRFEKRQRDLKKKKKQEEKRQRKLAARTGSDATESDTPAEQPEGTPLGEAGENAGTSGPTDTER
jgi:hypothetical protein